MKPIVILPGQRARSASPGRTAAIVATAGLALLATACNGPSSPGVASGRSTSTAQPALSSNAGGAQTSQMLAFSRCMRSHRVADFPDPNSSGELPKRKFAIASNNPQFVGAHRACEHLLPNSGQPTPAQVQQAWSDMRQFARCMRSHGVPNWPDPTVTSPQDNRPFFNTPASIDLSAPQIVGKINACQRVLHSSNPLDTTQ